MTGADRIIRRSTRLPYMSNKRAWCVMMTRCIPSLASSLAGRWATCVLTVPTDLQGGDDFGIRHAETRQPEYLAVAIGDRRCEAPST
jgi:hypothetical protein